MEEGEAAGGGEVKGFATILMRGSRAGLTQKDGRQDGYSKFMRMSESGADNVQVIREAGSGVRAMRTEGQTQGESDLQSNLINRS